MYVLDRNVLLELRRPRRVDPAVAAWARSVPSSLLFVSSVTILEIEVGTRIRERRDPTGAVLLRAWVDSYVLPNFEGRILPVDTAVALRCAALQVPDPRGYPDSLIAATALVHNMTVATRNVGDFAGTGVSIVNPWTWSGAADTE